MQRPAMHLNRFDLNQLIALDALLQEKNVTRAAERVFVSQPAMSSALGKLRDYFGDPLLVRCGRELELTACGLALVEPVREVLLKAQAVLGVETAFNPSTARRTFPLIAPDFAGVSLIPRVLLLLLQRAPGIRLQLENWSATAPTKLVNGEVDLLVTLDSPHLLGPEAFPECLSRTSLQPQRWVCALWNAHPLIEGDLTREQFFALPHICLRFSGDRVAIDETVRKRLNVALDVRVATDTILQIPFLLEGTPLLAVVPDGWVRQLTAAFAIRVVPVPEGILPVRHLDLFWHRRSTEDAGHTWIRSLLPGESG